MHKIFAASQCLVVWLGEIDTTPLPWQFRVHENNQDKKLTVGARLNDTSLRATLKAGIIVGDIGKSSADNFRDEDVSAKAYKQLLHDPWFGRRWVSPFKDWFFLQDRCANQGH